MKTEFGYIDESYIAKSVRPRKRDSNKGDFGTLALLCGSPLMTGAARLAAAGALRSGVGLLKMFGSSAMIDKLQAFLCEPVFAGIDGFDLTGCTAFLCGCGIGRYYDGILPDVISSCRVKTVFDADCINFIAANIDILKRAECPVTLTPHPGEMARLTGKSVSEIQSDRIGTAARFASEHGCVTVLKGSGTVVASPDGRIMVNTTGSSALAKGGSGDVLAGVIASLNAQGYGQFEAACIGVYLHGRAGDILSRELGESGVLPSDLPAKIGFLLG